MTQLRTLTLPDRSLTCLPRSCIGSTQTKIRTSSAVEDNASERCFNACVLCRLSDSNGFQPQPASVTSLLRLAGCSQERPGCEAAGSWENILQGVHTREGLE